MQMRLRAGRVIRAGFGQKDRESIGLAAFLIGAGNMQSLCAEMNWHVLVIKPKVPAPIRSKTMTDTPAEIARVAAGPKIYGATILTADGDYFDFVNPRVGITLNAIARGLANTCRFGGQCLRYYSVAEHSVWVSRLVPPEFAIVGLMHDAPEAFTGDMVKPLKEELPDFQIVEDRVERAVFAAFNLPLPLPPEVKAVDRIMLATEQRQIMNKNNEWKWTHKTQPADIVIDCLMPDAAYAMFMDWAVELGLAPPLKEQNND